MGTHISVYVRTHCPKGRGKYGKLVQWTEELPCFAHECKEQGSVIFFYSPEDHFSSTTNRLLFYAAMQHNAQRHPQ